MRSPSLLSPTSVTPLATKRRRLKLPESPATPLLSHELIPAPATPSPAPPPRVRRSLIPSLNSQWVPLHVPRSELSLSLTFPTGQTFRWRKTGPDQYTGVVGHYLVTLRHTDGDPDGHISYLLHGDDSADDGSSAHAALQDYLNLGVSLAEMWREFAAADPRFCEVAGSFLGGVRVLRQDPVECLFQFLCSSNNNIARIEKMVGFLSSLGNYLGSVDDFDFYQFPSIEQLSVVSEEQLREAGFGYRAKYVVGTVEALQSKPGGGSNWLRSLCNQDLPVVIDALCTLPGVGPKVAACIALFSLDQHHAIPVDTHVWQIATQHYIPDLAGARLTPKLFSRVTEAFVTRFGKYAGWAQTVLFIGELPSQKANRRVKARIVKRTKSMVGKQQKGNEEADGM